MTRTFITTLIPQLLFTCPFKCPVFYMFLCFRMFYVTFVFTVCVAANAITKIIKNNNEIIANLQECFGSGRFGAELIRDNGEQKQYN